MAGKTKAEIQADLDGAVMRIMELEAENKKLKAGENADAPVLDAQAHHRAAMLRPSVGVLGAKIYASGVLMAFYEDGERHIFDQDAQAAIPDS